MDVINEICTKHECVNCKEKFTINASKKEGAVPRFTFNKEQALCSKCATEGWDFCDECKKPYNRNAVNHELYQLLYPTQLLEAKYGKHRYCTSECYTIYNLEKELSTLRAEASLLKESDDKRDNRIAALEAQMNKFKNSNHIIK